MKSKMWFLTKISFERKVKTKWFVIANVFLFLAIFASFHIDSIIRFFGGDFNEKTPIYVIDDTHLAYDLFQTVLESTSKSVNGTEESSYEVTLYEKGEEEAKKELEKNKKIYILHFSYDENHMLKATFISQGGIDTVPYQVITSALQSTKVSLALKESSISEEELAQINASISIERIILDTHETGEEEGASMILSTIFPFFILPFFMLTLFLVQMIGAEVNDEKTTRGMEIIISNVSPKAHFFSKILAGNFFVLFQGVLLVLYLVIAYFFKKSSGGDLSSLLGGSVSNTLEQVMNTGLWDKLIYIIPLTLILMVLTFIGYSLLAGILASMTTNIEDFQQLQTPIMVLSMAGYVLSMLASLFQGSIFIRVCSYLPFLSAILSPSLLVLGHIGVIDILVSSLLMILTNYFLLKYGLRIYKVGILNYSSKGLWKKMFQAMKKTN